jgi:hypothetical protein
MSLSDDTVTHRQSSLTPRQRGMIRDKNFGCMSRWFSCEYVACLGSNVKSSVHNACFMLNIGLGGSNWNGMTQKSELDCRTHISECLNKSENCMSDHRSESYRCYLESDREIIVWLYIEFWERDWRTLCDCWKLFESYQRIQFLRKKSGTSRDTASVQQSARTASCRPRTTAIWSTR